MKERAINSLPEIRPLFTLAELFPQNTVMFPRTTVEKMRWVGFSEFQLDGITAVPISIAGTMPLICHHNAMILEIIDFFRLAGIHLEGECLLYNSADEAIELAKEWSALDKQITYYYPPPEEIFNDNNLVVTEALYNWLNDKANIDIFCGMEYLPRHASFMPDELSNIFDFLPHQPIYAKLCHPGVTGGGIDVYYCPYQSQRDAFIEWVSGRPPGWTSVRIEEGIQVRESWCLNLFISLSEVRYLGAAIQLFNSPASQSGSLIDPAIQPSDATIELAKDIAKRAGLMGYVGIAGFDIGEDINGKPYVFDLNFRPAACTPQVLFHPSATQRIDCNISMSWKKHVQESLIPVMRKLEEFVRKGQLVPLSLFERTSASVPSRVYGMLIASSREEIYKLESEINQSLAEFES